MTTNHTQTVDLGEQTANAYSFNRYANWDAVIVMLRRHGLTDREVEAVLRSKWTRWAADASKARYGRATSRDLERFIETSKGCGWKDVAKLTAETFA